MRSEFQYLLQKARALATELRCTLEALGQDDDADVQVVTGHDVDHIEHEIKETTESLRDVAGEYEDFVSRLEGILDDMGPEVIGEGSVKLEIESHT